MLIVINLNVISRVRCFTKHDNSTGTYALIAQVANSINPNDSTLWTEVKRKMMRLTRTLVLLTAVLISPSIQAQDAPAPPKPEFPPFTEVLKGYDKVVSTADGVRSLYTLYVRKKDNQIFAELPPNYMAKKYFIALTQASGDKRAGLQGNDQLVYWRRYDKKLALIAPELDIRSSGEPESVSSIKRLFTDSVILNVPIVTIGPGGGPIIDLSLIHI